MVRVHLGAGRRIGVVLAGASLADVTIDGCRLAAVSAWGSTWRDVTVRGGKIDFLNLRGAALKDVQFVDCVVSDSISARRPWLG